MILAGNRKAAELPVQSPVDMVDAPGILFGYEHTSASRRRDDVPGADLEGPDFDGIFFTGVRTTGIFCRSICTAKKPKRENVVFFPSAREALLAGYRPCRVCHPMAARGSSPTSSKPSSPSSSATLRSG
jgi:hypothetical protein